MEMGVCVAIRCLDMSKEGVIHGKLIYADAGWFGASSRMVHHVVGQLFSNRAYALELEHRGLTESAPFFRSGCRPNTGED